MTKFLNTTLGRIVLAVLSPVIAAALTGIALVVTAAFLNPLSKVEQSTGRIEGKFDLAISSMQSEHISIGKHQDAIEAANRAQDAAFAGHTNLDDLRDRLANDKINSVSQDVKSLVAIVNKLVATMEVVTSRQKINEDTFSGGVPTPEKIAATNARLLELGAEIDVPLPPPEKGEDD